MVPNLHVSAVDSRRIAIPINAESCKWKRRTDHKASRILPRSARLIVSSRSFIGRLSQHSQHSPLITNSHISPSIVILFYFILEKRGMSIEERWQVLFTQRLVPLTSSWLLLVLHLHPLFFLALHLMTNWRHFVLFHLSNKLSYVDPFQTRTLPFQFLCYRCDLTFFWLSLF